MPYILFKRKIGTVDMQLINGTKSYVCNGFCNKSYKPGPKVFVTYTIPPDSIKIERVLCINCAKAGFDDAPKYGYNIGKYDKKIDDIYIENL
jgi:hypothetical protein